MWPQHGRSVAIVAARAHAEFMGSLFGAWRSHGAMKALLRIFGLLLLGFGLLFMAQGSGYLPWPAESFMVGDRSWVFYGGAIAAIGCLLILASR
jgi:hypothetical protein